MQTQVHAHKYGHICTNMVRSTVCLVWQLGWPHVPILEACIQPRWDLGWIS